MEEIRPASGPDDDELGDVAILLKPPRRADKEEQQEVEVQKMDQAEVQQPVHGALNNRAQSCSEDGFVAQIADSAAQNIGVFEHRSRIRCIVPRPWFFPDYPDWQQRLQLIRARLFS
jgi:hypothetical protein